MRIVLLLNIILLALITPAFAQSQNVDSNVYYKSDLNFKLGKVKIDTIYVTVQGVEENQKAIVQKDCMGYPEVLSINESKVIKLDQKKFVSEFNSLNKNKLQDFYNILESFYKNFSMPDGIFFTHLCNVIVDRSGSVVYFEFWGIDYRDENETSTFINPNSTFYKDLVKYFNAIKFKLPASASKYAYSKVPFGLFIKEYTMANQKLNISAKPKYTLKHIHSDCIN